MIEKLDRLSRYAHLLLGLEKPGVDFVAADMPNANRLTVDITAMVAAEERRMISGRTKAAQATANALRVRYSPAHQASAAKPLMCVERRDRSGGQIRVRVYEVLTALV